MSDLPFTGIYGAAKRAAEIMFDALRLELAPFGVSVVTVVTGPVTSNVHTHTDMWKLPDNSLYTDVEGIITKRASGDDGAPRMDTMKYASGVVDKIMKGSSSKFWAGANVGFIKFMWSWLPTSWTVCALSAFRCFVRLLTLATGMGSLPGIWTGYYWQEQEVVPSSQTFAKIASANFPAIAYILAVKCPLICVGKILASTTRTFCVPYTFPSASTTPPSS